MIYTIENSKIKAQISSKGAELQSIYGKTTNFEYLWQADVEGLWKSRATVIFPICGRLFDTKYSYNSKEYEMIIHGFVKRMEFSLVEQSQDKITLEVKSDEETLKMYPFNFTFRVTYSLIDATVKNTFTVINDGKEVLPFSIGGHPGFKLPLSDGLNFEEHYIEFENAKKHTKVDFTENKLCTGNESYFPLENDKIVRLTHELFVDDAIFLSEDCNTATLKSDKSDRFVKMTFNNVTHVGLWQTYGNDTNFVCIEPWHGTPGRDNVIEDLSTKTNLIKLDGGKKFDYTFDITVSE